MDKNYLNITFIHTQYHVTSHCRILSPRSLSRFYAYLNILSKVFKITKKKQKYLSSLCQKVREKKINKSSNNLEEKEIIY